MIPLKLDSGTHPGLYKIGMGLYKINPKLWDYGIKIANIPDSIYSNISFSLSDKGDAKPMNTVNLELSVLCNLRCTMCWWWGEKGIAFKLAQDRDPLITEELSTQEIFRIIDSVAKDKPSFYLAGGEPFIRKDTVDIIEYITGKGMSVVTNNNGTMLTEEKLQRLAKVKKLTINFSIDGTEEVHDRIRGKGTFKKTTDTIRRLVELRGDSLYPAIKTNTTFSPWVAGHLDQLIQYLQNDVGVDAVRMQHLWFTDKAHAEEHKKMLHEIFGTSETGVDSHIISSFEPEYVKALADEILKVQNTKYKKPVFIHPQLTREQISRYYNDLNFTRAKRCYVAWGSVLVKANGDVMFCPDEWMNDFRLGNVRKESLEQMWHGEKARKFREELWQHKLFPACNRCCVISG